MAEDPGKPRCTGKRADGRACNAKPMPGTTRCWHHSFKVPGRPSKLTPEIQERILDAVLEGHYLETAAAVVGVNKTTLYRWLRRADDVEAVAIEQYEGDLEVELVDVYELVDPAEWVYLDFRHALKSAEAWAETELIRQVKGLASIGGWQAHMTILERRHPDRWGRRKVLDHTFKGELEERRTVQFIVPEEGDRKRAVAELLASIGALDEEA